MVGSEGVIDLRSFGDGFEARPVCIFISLFLAWGYDKFYVGTMFSKSIYLCIE